ncbi:hypothetical protein ABT009_31330 [Streptomyces sp. NPDC002896]|uniref:hypothetical protein n=1 Tax=Streptomyces sp. NPDC002896 TaxID=3154438 RepID=UPI0033174753
MEWGNLLSAAVGAVFGGSMTLVAQAIEYRRRRQEEAKALGRANMLTVADLLIDLINFFERVEPSLPDGLDDMRESGAYTSDLNKLRRHVLVITDREARERLQDVLDVLWWLSPIAFQCRQHWSFVGHVVARYALDLAGTQVRKEGAPPLSDDVRSYVGVLEAVRAAEERRT